MSVNGMSVGRDYNLSYYDNTTGGIVDLGDVQNVTITQQQHLLSNRPYNRRPSFGYIADGYSITFKITRTGRELEDFALLQQHAFDAGTPIRSGFLNETINDDDGTVRYQY